MTFKIDSLRDENRHDFKIVFNQELSFLFLAYFVDIISLTVEEHNFVKMTECNRNKRHNIVFVEYHIC